MKTLRIAAVATLSLAAAFAQAVKVAGSLIEGMRQSNAPMNRAILMLEWEDEQ